jgi:hypothetical protein
MEAKMADLIAIGYPDETSSAWPSARAWAR